MRNILLLFPFLLTAQPDFREGYVINNHGDTLHGTIDYRFNSNGLIFFIPSSLYNFSILGNVSVDLFKR